MKDVFVNIAGGLKVEDPAMDLAVCVSLISSFEDSEVPKNYCFAAEIGLSGEIRPVSKAEIRIQEAEKLGFDSIAISKFSKLGSQPKQIKIQAFSKVENLVEFLF